ncbi:MAG: hypothetical protein COB93_05935 [Sneathiella sp.]|nr:MAG: hypothetical protein COB93_05935 [Sneathiella sp.]
MGLDITEFAETLQEAISYNQLERYFTVTGEGLPTATSHYDIQPDINAIKADIASAGGLKLSHAQRRMLVVLVALWEGRIADEVFADGIGSLPKIVQSMDKNNRALFADLIVTFPGWGSI